MIILAIDTTTPSASIALLEKNRLLAEMNSESVITHSQRLLPSLNFLLESARLSIRDIEGYAVAAGPGSFTGIRIGLSTVKSLSLASGKPVAPVSTLKALALKMKQAQARLLSPIIDAKKKEIYAALFERKGERLEEIIPQGAYAPHEYLSLLPSNRIITFLGDGIYLYREKISEYLRDKARFSSRSFFIAYEVGILGYEMFLRKQGISPHELKPLYLRRSQAEEGG